MMTKRAKSQAMAMSEIKKVMPAMKAAKMEPQNPAPSAMRKAMNARPVTTGCRIMTRVNASVLSVSAVSVEKPDPSIEAMIAVGS